ncbi:major tail protein [Listeria monocytogenes]|uniref:major tail protein n=1 Tax=Listeria monocytogenes TaxID=1639 RepID=UPI003F9AC68B
MAQFLGFRKAHFARLTADNKVDGDIIIVEGKQDKGATVEASISGLSKEQSSVWGSDKKYFTSGKGTDNVESTLTILDTPEDFYKTILGFDEIADIEGAQGVGDETEAPYVAVAMETKALNGDTVIMALTKGKFRANEFSLETSNDGADEPEGLEINGSHESRDDLGKTFIKFRGTKADAEKLLAKIFPTTTPAPQAKSAK